VPMRNLFWNMKRNVCAVAAKSVMGIHNMDQDLGDPPV
jgi:hypothetical protein